MKNLSFEPEDELTVPPLTEPEKRWLASLAKVASRCPSSRLQAVVAGNGCCLNFIDGPAHDAGAEICDNEPRNAGILLAYVTFPIQLHSTSA